MRIVILIWATVSLFPFNNAELTHTAGVHNKVEFPVLFNAFIGPPVLLNRMAVLGRRVRQIQLYRFSGRSAVSGADDDHES